MNPLTHGQQALWIHQTLYPNSTLYNLAFAFECQEPVDPVALQRTFVVMAARHDALRMIFPSPSGAPEMVDAGTAVDFSTVDARHWNLSTLHDALRAAGDIPFNLARDTPMRVRLFLREDKKHAFSLTFHHIAIDLWSLNKFVIDFGGVYSGVSIARESGCFAEWPKHERKNLQGPQGEVLRKFWLERLQAIPQPSALPMARARPRTRTFEAGEVACDIDTTTTLLARRFAQQRNVTLYAVMLTAFFVFIGKYTATNQVVVGTPFSGRSDRRHRRTLGYFANPIPLQASIDPWKSFAELLDATTEDLTRVRTKQDYPFSLMVNDVSGTSQDARPAIYDIEFDYDRVNDAPELAPLILGRAASFSLGELRLRSLSQPRKFCERDIHFFLVEDRESLHGSIFYNRDLFDQDAVNDLSMRFRQILNQLLAKPNFPLGSIQLLNPDECHTILRSWNCTSRAYPPLLVHQQFERLALQAPNTAAIVFEGITTTRGELNRRANRLANYLLARGARTDTCIGILLPRSLELVVAVLAVLKAGAAFVPISPTLPPERRNFIIRDIDAPLLVDASTFSEADTEALDERNPEIPQRHDALAYVIYTSGSTGHPKGAMNQHGALLNRLQWMQEHISLEYEDVVAQKTPATFDVSVWELLWPLIAGVRMAVAREDGHHDPHYLAQFIRDERVTVIHFVPSMLEHFLDEPSAVGLTSLQHIVCSGEALTAGAAARVAERFPNAVLHNLYGPTEAAIDVTAWTCQAKHKRLSVPIGRPIANVAIYILDAALNPVPVGVPGELFIAGIGVGRGYWRRPALSGERFLPDPHAVTGGQRMYATGDIAVFATDGSIEYLGRSDFQVKINGQRLETQEIDALVIRMAHVKRAVTIAVDYGDLGTRLVCYFVPNSDLDLDIDIDIDSMQRSLLDHLPESLIPSKFVSLSELPLSPSGKIDRNALPRVNLGAEQTRGLSAPQGRLEQVLASIWSEVLNREFIAREHEFFALGGQSLLAIKVSARVRERLDCEVPITKLFQRLSLADLAGWIQTQAPTESFPRPIRQEATALVPLSFAQRQLWFLQTADPNDRSYMVTGALHLEGEVKHSALTFALRELTARHEILRVVFEEHDGTPFQHVLDIDRAFSGLGVHHFVGQRDALGSVDHFLAEQVAGGFELTAAPPWRVSLLYIAPQEAVLAFTLHHIICDGWSLEVLLRELSLIYSACVEGIDSKLPANPLFYSDYCHWQSRISTSPEFARQMRSAAERLADSPPRLELPTDWPRLRERPRYGGRQQITLTVELQADVQAAAISLSVTPFSLLLTALNLMLWRATGQRDLLIGVPVAGRHWTEFESIVGMFVNTIVVRTRVSSLDTARGLAQKVNEDAASAHSAGDVPFGTLVEQLGVPRDGDTNPLFNVLFTYQNTPPLRPRFAGLSARVMRDGPPVPKAELCVEWYEEDGKLSGTMEYDRSLFEPATVKRFTEQYIEALSHLCHKADELLGNFSPDPGTTIASDSGSQPPDDTLHSIVAAWAQSAPDRVAVACEGEFLTYASLNSWAGQIASCLWKAGVRPGHGVVLLMPRGVAAISSLFGILKIGAYYIPLEVTTPQERLKAIIADARPVAIVSKGSLENPTSLPTIDPDLCRELNGSLEIEISNPSYLAYAIYTSGSSGEPKAVMVTHRNVMNLRTALTEVVPAFNAAHATRFSLNAPLQFDASVQQLLALGNGHRLEIVSDTARDDPSQMVMLIRDRALTVVDCTPTHLQALIECGLLHHLPEAGLTLLVGGESIPVQLWETLASTRSLIAYNVYGPTEATVDVTAALITPGSHPHLGAPLNGTSLQLLSDDLAPAPSGAIAEICIAGAGLSLGYLNRPALTAERFIPDPHSRHPGARLYRTGDLGRIDSGGMLRYVGRRDAQVKIRGYRIELGEVEAQLSSHADVVEAVVRTDGRSERLIAFVRSNRNQQLTPSELHAWIAQRLPPYMHPARYVVLAELPRTPSGKVDRQRLHEPQSEDTDEPETPMERELSLIWQELLDPPSIRLGDSFFELGGHSLLAVRLRTRVQRRLDRGIDLKEIFEHSTLKAMAALLDTRQSIEPPRVTHEEADESLPSLAQERMLFLDRLSPGNTAYHVIGAVRLSGGNFSIEFLRKSLETLAIRHPLLRASFPTTPAGSRLHISNDPHVDLELIRLDASDQLPSILLAQAERSFDLTAGPLWRTAVVELGTEDRVLSVIIHHAITDAWSMEIFVRELYSLLGTHPTLPNIQYTYLDYANAQRVWLGSSEAQAQAIYWRNRLFGHSKRTELATDWPRQEVGPGPAGRVALHLCLAETSALSSLAQEVGGTLYMVLAAAFAVLLTALTGDNDVMFGTAVGGRDERSEGVLGLFVNTLPMRIDTSRNPSFQSLLHRIRPTFLADLSNQDLPFERIIDELRVRREPGRHPLFQSMLLLQQETQQGQASIEGLSISPIDIPTAQAKLDILLDLRETPFGLAGYLEFDRSLFKIGRAQRLADHFLTILSSAASNSSTSISRLTGQSTALPLVERSEIESILNSFQTEFRS